MARKPFRFLRAVILLKLATAILQRYRGKWLKRIILALLVAFLIVWDFYPTIGVEIAVPLEIKNQTDAQTLLQQGRKLYDAGQFCQAVSILQQSAAAFQAKKDTLGQAIAFSNLSLAWKQLGQLEKALYYITQSLNILKNSGIKNHNSAVVLAQTLELQGLLQLELGKNAAVDTWKQAVTIYNEIGDRLGKIRSQINLAQSLANLGFYRQAKTTLEQLSPELEKQPDILKATALRSLGDVLQLVGELEQSLKVLQQSLDVAQRLQSPSDIAAALLSLGNTQRALGNTQTPPDFATADEATPLRCVRRQASDEAVKFYQQAQLYYQQAATTSASPLVQIQAQLNQLSVLLELQKWAEAKKLSSDIQLKLTKIPVSQAGIYAQINLALGQGCLKGATTADIRDWKETALIASAIQQAKSIGDKRSQAYALGVLAVVYLEAGDVPNATKLTKQAVLLAQEIQAADIAYLWQWQLGYILRNQGEITEAIASYTEAVNTLKSLRNDLVALNLDVQFSFRDNVEPVYRQFVDLLLQPPPVSGGRKGGKSQQNLHLAREVIEALQLSELENFFREVCLQAKPKQIDEVVDKTDPTAAVIYPIILKDRLEIILKLPNQNQLHHYRTDKSQSEVESILAQLQQYLREPDRINELKKLSQQVYSWLIQPLEVELKKAKIETLVFVLDGSLRNIPMAVLYDEKQKEYLIQKYAIALAPGLQLIDPNLQPRNLDALIAGVSEQRFIEGRDFAPLENVKLELQQIQSEMPKTKALLNQTFTKTNLQNQINSVPFSMVHIATHGEFSSKAEQTFILTWEQLLKVKDLNNLLRQHDSNQSRAIELLVLSACETATGDKRAALGLAGISVRAGARSTLATLWSVDDKSTAELMSQFYQELANTKVTKVEALRRAQLALLANDENPYFWAAYVLVGNWL